MSNKIEQHRIWAVQCFINGEKPESICASCASLGRSKAWFYKWVERGIEGEEIRNGSRSRRRLHNSTYTPVSSDRIVPTGTANSVASQLRFPEQGEAPKYPQKKPETGRYHVIRFIRSDQKAECLRRAVPCSARTGV